MKFDFTDQRVIVTGGTRGIGKALSKAFLQSGATVIATYAGNDTAAEEFRAEMNEWSDRLEFRKFDVSDPEAIDTFFKDIESKYPSIEILINNSGIRRDNAAAMMPDEDWKRVIDVNLSGSFYMSKRAVLAFMKNRFGRIINMSSVGGRLGLQGQTNYAASKAGQLAMTKSLAKEVGKKGITVNCVCPGFIETELLKGLDEIQVKEYKKQVPLRRFGKPEEVANVVMFLADRNSAYITGTEIEISGGL